MAYPISEQAREELRAMMPVLLEEVLGITNLSRRFRCPSPDHKDATPSAMYYADSQTVHCFGCGVTWDIFSLVGMLEGITGFVEQAERAASILNVDIGATCRGTYCLPAESNRRKNPAFPKPKDSCLILDGDTCFAMFESLYSPEGSVAREYLHARGIDDDYMANHGLGFAKDPSDAIPAFRICEPSAKGFLMIPFYDESYSSANYCIARAVGTPSPEQKEWRPKAAASTLWQEWLLYKRLPIVYIAEGIFDAMSIEIRLHKPCIALCGTGNVPRLSGLLYRMPPSKRPLKLMVAMDEDEPGHRAASTLARDLDEIGVPYALLPPYPNGAKDANEWHMKGKGREWTYETELLGDESTPLHHLRGVRNEL